MGFSCAANGQRGFEAPDSPKVEMIRKSSATSCSLDGTALET